MIMKLGWDIIPKEGKSWDELKAIVSELRPNALPAEAHPAGG